jgi:hypothetical protein
VLDKNLIAARWYVGELSGEQMPKIACEALESGYDGKDLRYLAGLDGPSKRDITALVDRALRELGVPAPMAKHEAAMWMARRVAGEIVAGSTEPYAGACRIWLQYATQAPELHYWTDLAINYEVAAECGGIEGARQQIIDAARDLEKR